MNLIDKKITVICGHYGSGKTNLALNLAVDLAKQGEKVTLCDLDIVNPYFRSSDYPETLSQHGVKLIAPRYAHTNVDIPSLVPEMYSMFELPGKVIVDAGGDDAGASVLGRFAKRIIDTGSYDMLYVINKYRALTQDVQSAVRILNEIESVSRLKATGIVNNSHLSIGTDAGVIAGSMDFAKGVESEAGIKLRFTTCPDFTYDETVLAQSGVTGEIYKVSVLVTKPWQEDI